jgi:NADH dehydrogenase
MGKRQRIVIIGGGFAGLEFVQTISRSRNFDVCLVDANNYNFFPPLIYQVSTGLMEPSAISYPFRKILRGMKNVRFRLGLLHKVVPKENKIILSNGEVLYDILIMATGTETNYFGNKNIEQNSLPMKTISDALYIRNVIFTRLDRATRVQDPLARKRLLTFVIAGAGPTGVELSGVFSEMRANILRKDYPELSAADLGDIFLIDGQDTVLATMSKKSQQYTKRKLKELRVKIILDTLVTDFVDGTVSLSNGSTIESANLIWAAGVSARVFEGFGADSFGYGKRLKTNKYNLVEGYKNIYALGDCAIISNDKDYPNGHPQLAQPAIQQAKNLAYNLKSTSGNWKPFKYSNKGTLAIIGQNKAVFDLPNKWFMKGFLAWFIWIFVHIMGLVNFNNKLRTFVNWIGYYIYKDQSFRMIIKPRDHRDE